MSKQNQPRQIDLLLEWLWDENTRTWQGYFRGVVEARVLDIPVGGSTAWAGHYRRPNTAHWGATHVVPDVEEAKRLAERWYFRAKAKMADFTRRA